MKERINTYFAILLITIAGAGATSLIVHIAFSNTDAFVANNSAARYLQLQQSILRNK